MLGKYPCLTVSLTNTLWELGIAGVAKERPGTGFEFAIQDLVTLVKVVFLLTNFIWCLYYVYSLRTFDRCIILCTMQTYYISLYTHTHTSADAYVV